MAQNNHVPYTLMISVFWLMKKGSLAFAGSQNTFQWWHRHPTALMMVQKCVEMANTAERQLQCDLA